MTDAPAQQIPVDVPEPLATAMKYHGFCGNMLADVLTKAFMDGSGMSRAVGEQPKTALHLSLDDIVRGCSVLATDPEATYTFGDGGPGWERSIHDELCITDVNAFAADFNIWAEQRRNREPLARVANYVRARARTRRGAVAKENDPRPSQYPGIYDLAPVTGEATGAVLRFCSEACRRLFVNRGGLEITDPRPLPGACRRNADGMTDVVYGAHGYNCNKSLTVDGQGAAAGEFPVPTVADGYEIIRVPTWGYRIRARSVS